MKIVQAGCWQTSALLHFLDIILEAIIIMSVLAQHSELYVIKMINYTDADQF